LTREILRLWWSRLGSLFLVTAPPLAAAELLLALVDPTVDGPYENVALYSAFTAALYLVVVPWLQATVSAFHDDSRSRRRAYGRAAERIHALAGATFAYNVALVVGLVLLVVPGLLVGARWGIYPAVHSIGGERGIASLRRSNELVRGRTWRVVAVLALVFLASIAVAIPGGALLALGDPFSAWAGGTVIDIVIVTLFGTAEYVLYRRLDEDRAQ
jgi:hypothetical protein